MPGREAGTADALDSATTRAEAFIVSQEGTVSVTLADEPLEELRDVVDEAERLVVAQDGHLRHWPREHRRALLAEVALCQQREGRRG